MSQDRIQTYAGILEWSFAETLRVANAIPESNRLLQIEEGRVQPLWLVGHLANTLNTIVNMWMFERESLMPKGWGRIFAPDFGGGNPVTANAADYPAWDEVVRLYETISRTVLEQIQSLDDSVLSNPLPGSIPEGIRKKFPSYDASLRIMVIHDNYHRGQLGLLSKLTRVPVV